MDVQILDIPVLEVVLADDEVLSASLAGEGDVLSFDVFTPETVGPDPYEGEYVVNPDFTGQMLETANKFMMDDVTVNPIAVSITSNPQGGNTVYIGGELIYG